MKKIIAALVVTAAAAGFLSASDFNKIPKEPDLPYKGLGWLYFANDGLGHNYGIDEDSMRTWGFTSGYAFLNAFLVTLDWECFNDRGTNAGALKRIDEFKALAGWKFLSLGGGNFYLSVMAGPGVMLYGDFATLGLQTNSHAINNTNTRPVPEVYDPPSQSAMAFVYSECYFPEWGLDFTLYSHLTHKLDCSVDLSANYWVVKELTQVKFSLMWQYNQAAASGVAVHDVYAAENGFSLASRVMIGPLVFERGLNLSSLSQFGNAGIRIDLDYPDGTLHTNHGSTQLTNRNGAYRFTYSFGWPIGHNSNIEVFRVHPFRDLSRLAGYLGMYQTEDTYNAQQQRRIKMATTAGAEFYFNDPEVCNILNCYVFAGAGFSREVLMTSDVYQMRVLTECGNPVVHCGIACRFEIPDLLFNKKSRYIGAELKADIQYLFGQSTLYSNPYFLLSWSAFVSER